MKKKVIASMMALSMMAGLAACASAPAAAPAASGSTEAAADEAAPASETVAEAPAASGDVTTISMYFHGSNVTDDSQVLAELNPYLEEKIGVNLKPIWGTWGDFDENATLALQGGDDIDIYFTCSWSADEYNKFARDGYWVRLDDPDNNLIEKYASDLWALLPEVLTNGAQIEGADGFGVYAVPGYKDIATQNTWDVNVEKLNELGYDISDIEGLSYFDFGPILAAAKEKYGADFYPLNIEGFVLERAVCNSAIVNGDSGTGNFLSYYINPENLSEPTEKYGNQILNKFATDEFKAFAEKTREYYEAGYIDPALAIAGTANDTLAAKKPTGEYLIGTQSYALGYEMQASQERGFEVAMVPVTAPYVDTSSSQGAMMAISTASKNPEKAMEFLNLLNTDPKVMTLVNYGVEGVHYELEDGLVNFTDKRSDYQPWTNGVGNVTILPPTVAQGDGWWDTFKAYYGAAEEIPLLGFTYDNSEMETQVGNIGMVVSEYALGFCTGSRDVETELPEFLQKLQDAGIDDVIADANAQLQAFLEAKGE